MISMDELLKGTKLSDVPKLHQENLKTLLLRINLVRKVFAKPMTVTSGYRSMADHLRIYKEKGITDTTMIPMASKHLSGCAVDIHDPDMVLYKWCKANEVFLTQVGLWLEYKQGPWIHFQSKPFGSYKLGGTIWFNP